MNQLLSIIFLFLFSMVAHSADEISQEKKNLIDTLLEQTGQSAIAVGKQFSDLFIQQMTTVLKQSNPDIDPKAFDILSDEITSTINEEFVMKGALQEMMYPIYDKHFTEDDLEKIIELNATEIGKKMISVMPVITQEGMLAGQQFWQNLGPKMQQRIIARLQKEGIK